jgi:hypothetical protein
MNEVEGRKKLSDSAKLAEITNLELIRQVMTRECKVSRKSPRQCRELYCYQKFDLFTELLPAVLTLREEL